MEKPGDKTIAVCPDCLPSRGPRVKATLKLMPDKGKLNLVIICDNCNKMLGVVKENYE